MHVVILTGMSGSGKTQALNTLEDQGYYCIDNLPIELLSQVFETERLIEQQKIAVGIDIRSGKSLIKDLPAIISSLKNRYKTDIIYMYAGKSVLIKRYDETRRKHPLSTGQQTLRDSILEEYKLLSPVREIADLQVDTSATNVYELDTLIKTLIIPGSNQQLSLLFQSFGFKSGTPRDSDYLFDVRCLPNPYWEPKLRQYTGLEQPVQEWLSKQPLVHDMRDDLIKLIEKWVPYFIESKRAYITVSIGCTGGHHRSVYLTESLANHFRQRFPDSVVVQHRDLRE